MSIYLDHQIHNNPLTPADLQWMMPMVSFMEADLTSDALEDPVKTMNLRCAMSTRALDIAAETGRFPLPPYLFEYAVWHRAIGDLFSSTPERPLALAPDREVIDALRDAQTSEEVRAFALTKLAEHGPFCIDLPERALPLGRGRPQLQAVVGLTFHGEVTYCAVLRVPSARFGRRLHWLSHLTNVRRDALRDPKVAGICGRRPQPEPLTLLAEEGIEPADLRRVVDDIVLLSVTHANTAAGGRRVDWPEPPFMAPDDERRQGRRGRANAKKSSFSRVLRLDARGFTRKAENEGSQPVRASQCMRSRVAGHYRLQAHGPRHSLRRLTWIAEHMRGPIDAPVVTPLVKLVPEDVATPAQPREVIEAPPIFDAFDAVDQIAL